MQKTEINDTAALLKAMAHPIRLEILCRLQGGELSVGELQATVQTTNGNISQHLAILRDKEVLLTRKDANRVFYRVGDPRTLQLIAMMREVFCRDD